MRTHIAVTDVAAAAALAAVVVVVLALDGAALAAPSSRWAPQPGTSWQWQLSQRPYNYSMRVDAIDLDLDGMGRDAAAPAHAAGMKVICYINDPAPTPRPFPRPSSEKTYPGWPDERFLDIRAQPRASPPPPRKAATPSSPTTPTRTTPTPASPSPPDDAVAYLSFLSSAARALNMSIALKNNGPLLKTHTQTLLDLHDFAVVESCYAQETCALFKPFLAAGKPVLDAEYTDAGASRGCDASIQTADVPAVCAGFQTGAGAAAAAGISAIVKSCDLGPDFLPCPIAASTAGGLTTSTASGAAPSSSATSAPSSSATSTKSTSTASSRFQLRAALH
ncbi:glycoside hydrolase superfamily [Zopfochytrium polystomum]|nr:glycoside hydrolase superfamily [Zopfochytrium polystomum]